MSNSLYLAHIVLEAKSPLMIGSGEFDPTLDAPISRDWNDMPLIPASSLAGVLRAMVREKHGNDKAEEYFGKQENRDGARSLLIFSDALCHWDDNHPRKEIEYSSPDSAGEIEHGPSKPAREIATMLRRGAPVLRDHVRLDGRGVTEGAGKFDRTAVPRGARFSFEIETRDEEAFQAIQDILNNDLFIGGATRAGYGRMQAVETLAGVVAFTDREAFTNFRLSAPPESAGDNSAAPEVIEISGAFDGPLLIGGASDDPEKYNRAPYRETVIDWAQEPPTHRKKCVIPGSAIKGPLRHRTIWHFCRNVINDEERAQAAVDCLFGHAANEADGHAGKLRFEDAYLEGEPSEITVPHVGIDRFSGGARDGVLFTDRMLWRPEATFRIHKLAGCESCAAWRAFEKALEDLKSGLLGIGAEWGDGAGVFIASEQQEAAA